MTLYVFDKDEPNKSNWHDDCAKEWPPSYLEMARDVEAAKKFLNPSPLCRPEHVRTDYSMGMLDFKCFNFPRPI